MARSGLGSGQQGKFHPGLAAGGAQDPAAVILDAVLGRHRVTAICAFDCPSATSADDEHGMIAAAAVVTEQGSATRQSQQRPESAGQVGAAAQSAGIAAR
jgi:hypothetical protein